jgi:hypothetical protein
MFGSMEVCEVCAIAKLKQKIFNKFWFGKRNTPGQRIYIDISLIYERILGGAKFLGACC